MWESTGGGELGFRESPRLAHLVILVYLGYPPSMSTALSAHTLPLQLFHRVVHCPPVDIFLWTLRLVTKRVQLLQSAQLAGQVPDSFINVSSFWLRSEMKGNKCEVATP